MLNNLFIVLLSSLLLISGCATTTSYSSYISKTDSINSAIERNDFKTAYILSERYLTQGSSEHTSVMKIIRNNPNVLKAGQNTFTEASFKTTIKDWYGNTEKAAELEYKRIGYYKLVADKKAYQQAKSNYEKVFPEFWERYENYESYLANKEKLKKEKQLKAQEEERKAELLKAKNREKKMTQLLQAFKKANFLCNGSSNCKKAFSHTQIFINQNSDMKIQLATDTIISTYSPSELFSIGMKAVKEPGSGSQEFIQLTVACKSSNEASQSFCVTKQTLLYKLYSEHMKLKMKN
jgi:hypothetical protein